MTFGWAPLAGPALGRAEDLVGQARRLLVSASGADWVSDAADGYRSALSAEAARLRRTAVLLGQARAALAGYDRTVAGGPAWPARSPWPARPIGPLVPVGFAWSAGSPRRPGGLP